MAATPQVLFADTAYGQVTTGGTGTPATETMTVPAATASAFPAASNAASPPTVFYFADPAAPSEMMMCTNVSGAGNTTWAVTRGADGTTAVPHQSPFNIRGTVPAGVLASFQSLLTNGLQAYYKTVTVTPSATSNTFGTTVTLTPPSGYRFFLPLHVWGLPSGVGASENLTVLATGTLEDASSGGAAVVFTSGSGGTTDPANWLAAMAAVTNNNPGQTVTGSKRLASFALQAKSSIASSAASATVAWWAALIP